MNRGVLSSASDKGAELPDKVDMSLDEIIRLNKKEKQLKRKQENMNQRPVKKKKGRMALPRTAGHGPGAGGSVPRGLRNRKVPPPRGRWRGQGSGVVAARRPTAVLKRNASINRQRLKPTDVKQRQRRRPLPQTAGGQHMNPNLQRALHTSPQTHTHLNTHTEQLRRPFQLHRRAQPPVHLPVPQSHKETRQATFLFRRGLKVQTQLQKPNVSPAPLKTQQSVFVWSSSSSSAPGGGILTVSIDNPTARTQPEPPSSWTLHPPSISSTPVKVETVEKKIPKGVPLQFDINSVGKPQTSMTLNERFRILKDQRSTVAQNSKGGRFVTVG
ncbi:UAP56-interacting factor-like isoform X2 [Gouania willdenowi]|uniref:UAP56-interacting factor-like isoform X2 n=1 Tax=Gouania willdenowi TaxID=441366 RepID=UPI001056A13C|nr:UAP56-interacting factor isoform X2 [Gouania willdenowi]